MIHLHRLWIGTTLMLLALAACTNSNQPTAKNSSSPAVTTSTAASSQNTTSASPSNTTTPASTESKDNLTQMKGYVTEAVTAVKANDFAKAKAEFKEFDEKWEKAEDGVNAKSKDAYKKIESGMDEVKNTLERPKTPNKDKAIAALNSLSKTLDTNASSFK